MQFSLHFLLYFSLLSSIYANLDDEERYFFCNNNTGNYTNGSTYSQNVITTLSSLTANASLTGFVTIAVGDSDTVYGLVQCRPDVSLSDCQACVNTAAEDITRFCPNKKEAMIGYNNCLLRYSDLRFFSTASNSPIAAFYNTGTVNDANVFDTQLANLFRNISISAAWNASKFAAGAIGYSQFSDIYGMVQCTRDLSENDCSSCLQAIVGLIPQCCDQKQGARIYAMSCGLRFELYAFFSTSTPPISGIWPPPSVSPVEPSLSPGRTTNTMVIVVVPVAAVSFLVILVVGCCYLWRKAKKNAAETQDDYETTMESLLVGLDTLKSATANFSVVNKLGQGGFGPVYKGKLMDGREIAVKRLSSNSGQGLEELKTEVLLVAKLLHRNLVKLLGFCLEEEEKLLVYEYLPNGSLDKILFDQRKRLRLDWERRYKIIVGIARGLLYLHEDSQLRIIHRDLKASNILLDEQMNPKISDFGLAKLFGESQTQGNTNRIAGTYGYMAPEYAKNGYFSTRSDVYSFGMLVLEIVTGQKNSSFRNSINLQSHAWLHWTSGTAEELIDPVLADPWPRSEAFKCIHIGLLCVQETAADRPSMSDIISMLSSHSVTAPVPSRPAFFVTAEPANDSGLLQSSDSIQRSVNEVTISELYPR
ncbi:cysteine-rich RLK (RECEPTOR-like protein kinase) 25 [Hibiscus trionum]|uniref:Cysteine-rich RLK (RECEPTOR-like protein kinase) 25 n=1 Tax=Hibiscus trionum TaxID=183268 RepID=A0A9W7JBL3_HIBTR|nr:cysteine-rich RLK (RECEPTOR-like protein kinase) 25 [Hibiscus trionum]